MPRDAQNSRDKHWQGSRNETAAAPQCLSAPAVMMKFRSFSDLKFLERLRGFGIGSGSRGNSNDGSSRVSSSEPPTDCLVQA